MAMARYFRGAYLGKGQLKKDGYLGFTVALWSTMAIGIEELKRWERHERKRLHGLGLLPNHPNAQHGID